MGVVTAFGASRSEQTGGVTLAQLSELVERATQAAVFNGIDPMEIEPKIRATLGGRIREITVEV